MKISKPQSLTTDTRLSQSNFFNNSLLNKTNITTSSQKNNNLANAFQQYQSKQTDFLKVKNIQLQDRVKRMTQQIKELEENKIYILKMNEKYVKVVNQYYRDLHQNNQLLQASNDYKSQNRNKQSSREKVSKIVKNKSVPQDNPLSNPNFTIVEDAMTEQVFAELQKDHRNLVKHCLVMQNQIKNYAAQMEKFNVFKAELLTVNHTAPKQLISELEDTVQQNKNLKKQNNRLSFQLQKSKAECNKLKIARQNQTKNLASNFDEAEKLKAKINKVIQQSTDKSNQYEQRIYDLQLKTQKLEKQLRSSQQNVNLNQEKRKNLQIQRVQSVHENSFLRANLTELLDPKKHPLLRLDRSFVYKKNKDKSMSLNKSIAQRR